jgi:ABC-2 type transport system permease protein
MLTIIFTLLPAFLLSGFIFPVSSMPEVIQAVSYLVPARYFLSALRGIFLKGSGIHVIWPTVLPLAAFALGILALCAKKMRLSLE